MRIEFWNATIWSIQLKRVCVVDCDGVVRDGLSTIITL